MVGHLQTSSSIDNTTAILLLATLSFALCNVLPFLLNLAVCANLRSLDRRRSGLVTNTIEERSNSAISNYNSATGGIQYFEPNN
uniref:G_PROTEIN_RECEP_F1_2 domain-containing protein n=1 Tax=Meloidogyne hapla TaxID=6305 RepID=A0A1I8BC75_MELHA